jgi:UDP:flavonoid glycosyltransferase YjiC (YdhE family)
MAEVAASPAPSQGGQLVFIPALGSLGDVWPYVALARRLRKMGFRVRLGTHLRYKDVTDMKGI